MDARDIEKQMTHDDVFKLLEYFDMEPIDRGNRFECLTLCHGGDSHKLFYYKDSKRFMCFTNCHNMDIFGLVEKILNKSFIEALKYIEIHFNIRAGGTKTSDIIESPLKTIKKVEEKVELKVLDENILNTYYDKYHQSWIDEGITVDTMKKFGIKYSILDNQIIIPHRDVAGNLVGVRVRNLNQELIDRGKKYIPAFFKGKSLKYPTGENLYGLNVNKDSISRTHKIVLFEAEKSVLKLNSSGLDIGVALNGSFLGRGQEELLDSLDINEVIVAMDKEFDEADSDLSVAYAKKISSIFKKISNKYRVSVLWDKHGLLQKQDSPIDRGIDTFNQLMRERIYF